MSQIQIISDLHLESPAAYDVFEIPPQAPHLALLGDIGYVKDEGLFMFIRKQLQAFQTVFFLMGNHEPYHSSWNVAKSKLRDFQSSIDKERLSMNSLGKFVFLDKTRFELSPKVVILGCTLHSRVQAEQQDHVSFGLNDFYHIKEWTVEDHTDAHSADLAWLNEQVSEIATMQADTHVVILTHHSPTLDLRSKDPNHATSKISSGFMTDLSSEYCWRSMNVKVWAFGHTHFNCDFAEETSGKGVVTNQRGYYFSMAQHFEARKVICVPDT